MPRKQNFKVTSFINENAISRTPANSQHSILSNSTTYGSASPETCKDVESLLSRKEDDRPKITLAWMCAAICGLGSLAFILCFAYLPTLQNLAPHNHRNRRVTNENHLKRVPTGKFEVYPNFSDVNQDENKAATSDLPYITHVHYINISDNSAASEIEARLTAIIGEYPKLSNGQLAEDYVRCYLENPTKDRPCYFNPAWLGESCTAANNFGYTTNEEVINPCFLLRLEKTSNWKPKLFDYEEVGNWKPIYDPAFVAVDCIQQGDDDGKIDGIQVYPQKGFPIQFFPVSNFNPEKYLLPMVMVQVRGLTRHDAVSVECRLRAKNSMELLDIGSVVIRIIYDTQFSDTTTAVDSVTTEASAPPVE